MNLLKRIKELQEQGSTYDEAYEAVMENDHYANHIYFEQQKDYEEGLC